MNDNQRAILAYLEPYLNRDLPPDSQMVRDLKRPGPSIQSTIGSLERAGLIQIERFGGKPGSHGYRRVLRYWREAPKVQERPEPQRALTIEDREAELMRATKR